MLDQCWTSVCNAGPTLIQHRVRSGYDAPEISECAVASVHAVYIFFLLECTMSRRLGAKGSYLTLVRVADRIL